MEISKESVALVGCEADGLMKAGRLAEAKQKYELIYKTGFHKSNACRRLIQLHQLLLDMKSVGLWYRKLLEEQAFDYKMGTDLVMSLLLEDKHPAKDLLELCKQFYSVQELDLSETVAVEALDGRKIKLGFLSSNFHSHPVYFFLIGALEKINRDIFEIHLFCSTEHQDLATKRVHKAADKVHDVLILENADLNSYLRAQNMDVLFELDGIVPEGRIQSISKRVAPVQAAWAGQFCSTGHPLMDYFIADTVHIDEGNRSDFLEKVILSERGYITYSPPEYVADLVDLPAKNNHFITFGSLNNPKKISDKTVKLWAAVLNRVPNSKLLLRFGQFSYTEVREQLYARFSVYGIQEDRFILLESENHKLFVDTYNSIDIALDSTPYSGGLTTLEALWMGVPVVALKGERFSSRHSASHLTQLGLDKFVTENEEAYVDVACSLAKNVENLSELRLSMRDRMTQSPLMDHLEKAKELEAFCIESLANVVSK